MDAILQFLLPQQILDYLGSAQNSEKIARHGISRVFIRMIKVKVSKKRWFFRHFILGKK